jgi:hypothetical protein
MPGYLDHPDEQRPFWPRNPFPQHPRPTSRPQYETPDTWLVNQSGMPGAPARWSAYAGRGEGFVSVPYEGGGYGGGRNDLNIVSRQDFYNSATDPWPRSGVWDEPGAWHSVIGILRLPPTTSAHPGLSLTSGEASPAMLFHTPPVWGMQTTPIYAVGI